MTEHDLKIWTREFQAVAEGLKRFEHRVDDRGFEVGDVIILREWEPGSEQCTGRVLCAHVTYLVRGPDFGVAPGHVVMSILPDPLLEPWAT